MFFFRFAGLDFSALAGRLVEGLLQELEMELGQLEMHRAVQLFHVLASLSMNVNQRNSETIEGGFNSHRSSTLDRQDSSQDWSKVKEVQGLSRLVAQVYTNKTLPDAKTLLGLWEVQGVRDTLATSKVNQARKFLHSSSTSSDGSSWMMRGGGSSRPKFREVKLSSDIQDSDRDPVEQEVEEGENGEEGFLTPPSSVMSQGSSMETCDEGGGALYLFGGHPTQEDRRVVEATSSLQLDHLNDFPRVAWYVTHFFVPS